MKQNQNDSVIIDFFNRLINMGVHPDLPIIESRRVKMLNIIALFCTPFILMFLGVNFFQQRWILTTLNLVNFSSLLLLFWMHRCGRYLAAKWVRIILSVSVYTASGLLYHNGTEYCLIGTLVISILVFDNKWAITGLSILITAAILAVTNFHIALPQIEPILPVRVHIIIVVSLLFIIVTICFYKRIQYDYQKEIEAKQQSLLVMNRDKERLLSIVSHDIRGPLLSLEHTLHLYCNDLIGKEDVLEASESIRKKVSHLNNTVEILLQWSTSGMQGIQTHPRYFSLLDLANEVVSFFEFIVQQKKITVNVGIPAHLGLFADRDQMAVVFRNLFSNALKFSYMKGEVDIVGALVDQDIVVSVKDRGMGMDEKVKEKLFNIQQAPSYGTNGERGIGLGLLLSREFVVRNNGNIQVQSSVGNGTCFQLRFRQAGGNQPVPAAV
jgi:signal transduction histidine kinase